MTCSIEKAQDDWSSWTIVNATGSHQLAAAGDTPPVLVRTGDHRLHLLCRGADDNLYLSSRDQHGDWSPWQQLVNDHSVQGRLSLAFTDDPRYAHVVYAGAANTVHYRRFNASWSPDDAAHWSGMRDGEIASDGTGELFLALRSDADRLRLERLHHPWDAAWETVANEHGQQVDQPCLAISNVVWFGDAFHVLYCTKALRDDIGGTFAYSLAHTRVMNHRYADGYFRALRSYTPVGERHPQAALAPYRDRLIAAFCDENTDIRYAWLDTADVGTPWIGGRAVAGGKSRERPGLAAIDGWTALSELERRQANFGDDLFAVVTGLSGDSVWFGNFSRSFFTDHLASIGHRVDWCTNYGGAIANCPAASELPAVTDIPEYSEIGRGSMAIPHRLMSKVFPAVMQHVGTPGADYMAWVHTQLLPRGSAYIGPHLNVDHNMRYAAWLHEMLHRLATNMALWDDDVESHHPNPNLMTDEFPDYLVTAATALFREATNGAATCDLGADGQRCRGFIRTDKYDVGSCQHSFIELLQLYMADGDALRGFVAADLRAGTDLLRRKYDWVRHHVFNGVEFGSGGKPIHPVHIVNVHSKKALDVASWSLDDNAAVQQYELHRGDNQRWLLAPTHHGFFQLVAMHSGMCLDVVGVSADDGARVQQYAPHGGHNQQWALVPGAAGTYELVARHSGKCLEVVNWSLADHAAIGQYQRLGGNNQRWTLEPA